MVTCAMAVALTASPPNARAEESSPEGTAPSDSAAANPRELARVRYRRGVEAFDEGRFREAIDLFLDADQLAPSAALSFNIAAAYEKIDQPAAALRWYRDFLRRAPDASDRPQVETSVRKLEERLQASGVQQLMVSSSPSGAALSVDGRPVGTTPWIGELPPGPHRLQLALADHAPLDRDVDVNAAHATDVSVELTPQQAPVPAPATMAVVPATRAKSPTDDHAELRTFGWVGLAAGGAALGGALTFELLRRSAEGQARDDASQIGYADKLETVHDRQTVARVLLGVGGALAVTSGVLLWFGREPAHPGAAGVGLVCGPAGCTTAVRARF